MIDIEVFKGKWQEFVCINGSEQYYDSRSNEQKREIATDFINAAVKLVGKDEAIKIMEGE